MATYTPNYNLSKPESTDTQSDYITAYCGNLDIIDQHMNDGGDSGHTIEDGSGTAMTARANLQFVNCTSVTDDSVNDRTIVQVLPFKITGNTTDGFDVTY